MNDQGNAITPDGSISRRQILRGQIILGSAVAVGGLTVGGLTIRTRSSVGRL